MRDDDGEIDVGFGVAYVDYSAEGRSLLVLCWIRDSFSISMFISISISTAQSI